MNQELCQQRPSGMDTVDMLVPDISLRTASSSSVEQVSKLTVVAQVHREQTPQDVIVPSDTEEKVGESAEKPGSSGICEQSSSKEESGTHMEVDPSPEESLQPETEEPEPEEPEPEQPCHEDIADQPLEESSTEAPSRSKLTSSNQAVI